MTESPIRKYVVRRLHPTEDKVLSQGVVYAHSEFGAVHLYKKTLPGYSGRERWFWEIVDC